MLQKGVTAPAENIQPVKPVYPRISRRRDEQGKVSVRIRVSAGGQAVETVITESSGHSRLDRAALEAVHKARFRAAKRNGKAIESELELTFNFRLENSR